MSPLIMALLLLVEGAFFLWTMRRRLPPLVFARPEVRWDRLGERVSALVKFGLGQGRMATRGERTSGIAHVLVFASFMVLAIRTITLVGMGFSKDFHLPFLAGDAPIGIAYAFVKEIVVVGALVGLALFLYFRVVVRKERLTLVAEGWIILLVIASLMITELLFEGGDLAAQSLTTHPFSWPGHLFAAGAVGKLLLATSLDSQGLHALSTFGYWAHVTILLSFGNFLPYGKHFHIITGLPDVFFRRLPPIGDLKKLDLENSEKFGAANVFDLSWKELLDTYSCTECGRCQTHCPTYVTGKPLSHKEVNRAIRHSIQDLGPKLPLPLTQLLAKKQAAEGATATGPQLPAGFEVPALAGENGILPDETIWACTTCGWCEQACPVFIEQIPRIIDMRRNKVLMEAVFPEEAQRVFDGMESQSNPWGVGSNKRGDWAEGLGVPVAANLAEAGQKFEYLFFVGCAGSYDDRQKKVSRALARIFKDAKVDYAILGAEEGCTGDSARRLGNEYLFQTMVQANIEKFNTYGVTKIITQCPHCFNTLANEYPAFGVKYEVLHHTQVIEDLLKKGRITLTKEIEESMTFHDSCYLARYNGITEAPREVLASVKKLKVLEMPRNREQGFCCGAGGGRMWLEEKLGSRVNQNRVEEAAATGASTVVTSCPFCLTMIKDGIAETGREDKLQAKDLAEIVVAAMPDETPA